MTNEPSKTQRKRLQREQATAQYLEAHTTPHPPADPAQTVDNAITAFTRQPMNRAWRRGKGKHRPKQSQKVTPTP